MAEITKPDMSSLWASDGAVIAPTSAKIKTGWTPEIPPHQWENFVQNRQDNAIAYLFQRGVPEWDSSTEYFNNKSLVMGSNGVLYRAVSNNAGVNPTTDSGANWISLTANASESVAGIIKIATTAQANAMTDDNVAITPAKLGGLLGGLLETKSIIAGNGLTGGGTLDTTRTLTLGTPSTLSGNTANSVTANSHTHALASASESIAGVARIATTAEAQALVADDVVITPKKLGDVTATETRKGIIEIATAAEAQALTDDQRALTPKKLADAFGGASQGLTVNGYQKLPGGLIIQWGLYNQNNAYFAEGQKTVNLPITFPNAILVANATSRNSQGYEYADTHVDIVSISTTQIVFFAQATEGDYSIRKINGIYWLAIGY